MKVIVREGRSMGSPLRLTLPGTDDTQADRAWQIVTSVFRAANGALTRFDARSPLSSLNQAVGNVVVIPPLLGKALHASWRAFRTTKGQFDPRIIGALEAAGERAGVPLPPSPGRLRPEDRWLWLDLPRRRARISAPIDLGGIGKGLALRWAGAALRGGGNDDFLLQAGGDLVAGGVGPAARPWVIGIEDPRGGRRSLATVELSNAAIATSSIAVHPRHLIDPSLGRPAKPIWWSVTVRSRDPAWAEVLSKSGYLAGSNISLRLAHTDAWWIGPDGALHGSTAGPEQMTRLEPARGH